jgi:hypothetical protein
MNREKLKDFAFDTYMIFMIFGQAILLVKTILGIVTP